MSEVNKMRKTQGTMDEPLNALPCEDCGPLGGMAVWYNEEKEVIVASCVHCGGRMIVDTHKWGTRINLEYSRERDKWREEQRVKNVE